jgi:hypothetical protein
MSRVVQRVAVRCRSQRGGERRVTGAAALAILGFALGHAAAAQQPARSAAEPRVAPPEAVWTPAAAAPAGLLTSLEAQHHDRFIDRARAGGIDVVFFGTTSTEMWSWRDRGRGVWDRTFGSVQAASFGSQGTRFASLLWRMRNGELDGYQAKLVVLQGFGPGDAAIGGDDQAEFVTGYADVVAEIRARQPRAKVLLFAEFPRGRLGREPWRRVAASNAAVYAELADGETVFYVDIGERFFRSDGSFDGAMWGYTEKAGVGIQTTAFEAWAEELRPWLDRFVR